MIIAGSPKAHNGSKDLGENLAKSLPSVQILVRGAGARASEMPLYFYVFVWEIAYKLMAVAIPILLFDVQLKSMCYVGIALIIFDGLCLK